MSSFITITVMLVWGVPRIATVLCVHSLFCILLAEILAKVALCGPLIPNDTHFWPKFRPASREPGFEQWFHIQCRAGPNFYKPLFFYLWCIGGFCGNPGTKKNVLDGKTIADMRSNRKCWPKFRPHRQKKAEYKCMNGD